jgi:DNA-binding transcriptional MerR regulator
MEKPKYLIQEASQRVGVHRNTLKNLEDKGIINPTRSLAGQRRYSEDDLQKIRDYYEKKRESK